MRRFRFAIGPGAAAFLLLAARGLPAQDAAPKPAASDHFKEGAASYRIALEAGKTTPLDFREEPVLRWTNPQRRADDGAVYVWTDRGRPEVAASFYRYKADDRPFEDHEFVSLSESPLTSHRDGEVVWSVPSGNVRPEPIPGAPAPATTAAERLRQMRALSREFRANFNTSDDHSEIRLLPQPLYRFEAEGKRDDVLDGALFAYVHTTDPEVLLLIEARPPRRRRAGRVALRVRPDVDGHPAGPPQGPRGLVHRVGDQPPRPVEALYGPRPTFGEMSRARAREGARGRPPRPESRIPPEIRPGRPISDFCRWLEHRGWIRSG